MKLKQGRIIILPLPPGYAERLCSDGINPPLALVDLRDKVYEYMQIAIDHGFLDNPLAMYDDITRVIKTLKILIEARSNWDIHYILNMDAKDIKTNFNKMYDETRLIANTLLYLDSIRPIIDKWTPTDDQKEKIAEFIKKQEDKDEKPN